MLFIQLIFYWRDSLASHSEAGISALTYGWMIMQVPETLIGTAIATALLPTLSELSAREQWVQFKQTVERAVQVLIAICLPATAVLAIGVGPLVRLVFAGRFSPEQLDMLVGVSQAFLIGLAGQSLLEVAVRSFYAIKNALIPLFASAMNLGICVFLSWILSNAMGVAGIALAISISYTLEMVVLFILLNGRLPSRLDVSPSLVRAGLASLVGGGLTYLILNGIHLPLASWLVAGVALAVGGLAALLLVQKEIRLLFRL